jgi:hypothetical protein
MRTLEKSNLGKPISGSEKPITYVNPADQPITDFAGLVKAREKREADQRQGR